MWRQNHTNTMLRFPHETLHPILLNHIVVVHESKNTEIKKTSTKKGAKEVKEVAEECSKKKNGDEAEGDGSSRRSKGSESTAAKKEEEGKDTSLPVVGDEPVIVKSRPQETKEEVKEINNITEVAVVEEGGGKNEKEEEQKEQAKTVTPNKTKKKCIVQ